MEISKINKLLWEKIQPYYEKNLYSDALRIACLFVLDIIRDKSESDKDGEKLIQEAFLGKSPKIVINNFVSESEKDEQRGFGLLLEGLVCSVRNPISHELDCHFDKDMADAIIMYINNYILKKLDVSKEFSYVDNWTKFILDENYVEDNEYLKLIISNMSQSQRYNTIIELVDNLYKLNKKNRKLTIENIISNLNPKYYNLLIDYLNKALVSYEDNDNFIMFLNNFPASLWKDLNKIVSIRLENIILNSICEGEVIIDDFYDDKVNDDGILGTWLTSEFLNYFSNKKRILEQLKIKLTLSKEEGRYVLNYFRNIIKQSNILAKEDIIRELSSGNINYYELFKYDDEYKEYIDNFCEDENYFYINFLT